MNQRFECWGVVHDGWEKRHAGAHETYFCFNCTVQNQRLTGAERNELISGTQLDVRYYKCARQKPGGICLHFVNLDSEYEGNDAHRTGAVRTLAEFSFIFATSDDSHEPCHEDEYDTEPLLHRKLEFRNSYDWNTQYVDVGEKVYRSKCFVGSDGDYDIREDVQKHQRSVRKKTKYDPEVYQISGDFVGSKDPKV